MIVCIQGKVVNGEWRTGQDANSPLNKRSCSLKVYRWECKEFVINYSMSTRRDLRRGGGLLFSHFVINCLSPFLFSTFFLSILSQYFHIPVDLHANISTRLYLSSKYFLFEYSTPGPLALIPSLEILTMQYYACNLFALLFKQNLWHFSTCYQLKI